MINYSNLIKSLLPAVLSAGNVIMSVYKESGLHDIKQDGSPVTKADKLAEVILLKALSEHAPDIQIISEENPDSHRLEAPSVFFLVDPLDGTKEFIKQDGKGAFTVNIALIEDGAPTMGIVYAPALERLFYGAKAFGAYENNIKLKMPELSNNKIAVASISHRDATTNQWLEDQSINNIVSIGSSLKFVLLAANEAHVYPRFSPTMEWDTAAGDAILRAAGGMVYNIDGTHFEYGKPDYRNGDFIAFSTDETFGFIS